MRVKWQPKKIANTGFDLAAAWGMTAAIPQPVPTPKKAETMPENIPASSPTSPPTREDNCDSVFKTLTTLTAALNSVRGNRYGLDITKTFRIGHGVKKLVTLGTLFHIADISAEQMAHLHPVTITDFHSRLRMASPYLGSPYDLKKLFRGERVNGLLLYRIEERQQEHLGALLRWPLTPPAL